MSSISEARQSSISVAVRVRPFTQDEMMHLVRSDEDVTFPTLTDSKLVLPGSSNYNTPTKSNLHLNKPIGIRKIVDCVDGKMLIFDPAETNPLNKLSETVLNSMYSRKQTSRRNSRRNGGEIKFIFDQLFDEDVEQSSVYQATTSPLLDSVLDGFNSTVFAYGATGCGKTYTISGTPENPGIIFLAMQQLFEKIDNLKDIKNINITLSYLEIYNESIRDLLKPETSSKRLVIREDSENTIKVANLSHHTPQTVEEVMDLVIKGNLNRTTSATDANETSSRSHAVLQIHISQTNRTADLTDNHTFATLSIIDLAGSERAATTKNRGERLYEGANINRSLLALGNCINALCMSDGTRRTCHVPYRDSKLTRLLKFSLGGNCKTVMIVCVSPSSSHYDETLNTLKYANRAKEIKTKIIRNQQSLNRHVGSYLKMITEQKREIDELRKREKNMIGVHLQKVKVGKEKIHFAINKCVSDIQKNYMQSNKLQKAKNVKSLILCKRRLLQMISMELNEILAMDEYINDAMTIDKASLLQDQISNKIKELEEQFDTPDELDVIIENTKNTELQKLSEMEYYEEQVDDDILNVKVNHFCESIRNEVLVNASMLVEKLFKEEDLMGKCKFLSRCLAFNYDINEYLEKLLEIDENFDVFSKNKLSQLELSPTFAQNDPNEIIRDTEKLRIISNSSNIEDPPESRRNSMKTTPSIIDKKSSHKPLRISKNNDYVTSFSKNSPTNSPSPKNLQKLLSPASSKLQKVNWLNNADPILSPSSSAPKIIIPKTRQTQPNSITQKKSHQMATTPTAVSNNITSKFLNEPDLTDIDVSMQDIHPPLNSSMSK